MWPVLIIIILLGALVWLHLSWRGKLADERARAAAERETLKREHESRRVHARAEQDALFNSMPEGVVLLDGSGRIRLANEAFVRLFGVPPNLEGKTLLEAVRRHEVSELVDRLRLEAPLLGHEMKLPGLEDHWLQVSAASVPGEHGHQAGTVLVFHDLTRLKRLERTREEFVANVSHELRTPLSLIKGYAETLLDGARNNPEVAERFLRIIERNSQRLDLLIQDLLTISALESGRLKLNLKPVPLRSLAEKVLTDLKSRAENKSMVLVNQLPDVAAIGDEHRLDQVLANLVDNAIKYGRTKGNVTIGGRCLNDEMLEIFVQDDGPGIPAEALERVFERFYRVDKARSRDQGGTGLGLSIVKHIVQSHGGSVWAKSEPGKGATFFFTLPRSQGPLQIELETPEAAAKRNART